MSGGLCNINNNNKKDLMIIKKKKRGSKVLELILKSPGIRYRQLIRLTGYSHGSVSFLLKKLEKSRSIIVERSSNNRVTGYYPKNITTTDLRIISNLRIKTEKRIVQLLLKQGQSTFNDIVNYTDRAPSTISWHLNKLRNAKLITLNDHHGRPRPYKIRNKKSVAKIISNIKVIS
jgi:predicted transcriptional regulator